MGVIEHDDGGFQPICDDCGIALCWCLNWREYEIIKDFWDAWKCDTCGGGVGAINKYLKEKENKYNN